MKHSTNKPSAQRISKLTGISLTKKRQQIFSLLLNTEKPISAYEIVDHYQETYKESIPVMSVYRILKFLTDSGLSHKLSSTNQYMACEHLSCEHEHLNAQFLICDKCNATEEIALEKALHQSLADSISKTGFKLNHLQFELHGTCTACQEDE